MKTYLVEYVESVGKAVKMLFVTALDYTKAYFEAMFTLPISTIIMSVTSI